MSHYRNDASELIDVSALLLIKAFLKRNRYEQINVFTPPDLSTISHRQQYHFNESHYHAYCDVVDWPASAELHPLYLQALSLPLQLRCFIDSRCPFAIMGMLHVSNEVVVLHKLNASAAFTLTSQFVKTEKHAKGWLLHVRVEAQQQGRCCYVATGYYLAKVKAPHVLPFTPPHLKKIGRKNGLNLASPETLSSPNACFAVPRNIGRRYARVSGDFNPIHLSGWLAKPFGLKLAIAHGMWSQAKMLSCIVRQALYKNQVTRVVTQFKQPIFLPDTVWLERVTEECESASSTTQQFTLQNADASKTYLHASIDFKTD